MTLEELEIQNRYLASEIERLNNNVDYIDQKLNEELDKSIQLSNLIRQLHEELKAVISCGDKMSIRTGQFACSMHYKSELKDWADLTAPIKNRA
jgi:D-ribose pyranose/furanose isomerase RbsD